MTYEKKSNWGKMKIIIGKDIQGWEIIITRVFNQIGQNKALINKFSIIFGSL